MTCALSAEDMATRLWLEGGRKPRDALIQHRSLPTAKMLLRKLWSAQSCSSKAVRVQPGRTEPSSVSRVRDSHPDSKTRASLSGSIAPPNFTNLVQGFGTLHFRASHLALYPTPPLPSAARLRVACGTSSPAASHPSPITPSRLEWRRFLERATVANAQTDVPKSRWKAGDRREAASSPALGGQPVPGPVDGRASISLLYGEWELLGCASLAPGQPHSPLGASTLPFPAPGRSCRGGLQITLSRRWRGANILTTSSTCQCLLFPSTLSFPSPFSLCPLR